VLAGRGAKVGRTVGHGQKKGRDWGERGQAERVGCAGKKGREGNGGPAGPNLVRKEKWSRTNTENSNHV
jgi:hypothetical protein